MKKVMKISIVLILSMIGIYMYTKEHYASLPFKYSADKGWGYYDYELMDKLENLGFSNVEVDVIHPHKGAPINDRKIIDVLVDNDSNFKSGEMVKKDSKILIKYQVYPKDFIEVKLSTHQSSEEIVKELKELGFTDVKIEYVEKTSTRAEFDTVAVKFNNESINSYIKNDEDNTVYHYPKDTNIVIESSSGKILPKISKDFLESYEVVKKVFEDEGFTNIKVESNEHDVTYKPAESKVTEILINGKDYNSLSENTAVKIDTPIIIRYAKKNDVINIDLDTLINKSESGDVEVGDKYRFNATLFDKSGWTDSKSFGTGLKMILVKTDLFPNTGFDLYYDSKKSDNLKEGEERSFTVKVEKDEHQFVHFVVIEDILIKSSNTSNTSSQNMLDSYYSAIQKHLDTLNAQTGVIIATSSPRDVIPNIDINLSSVIASYSAMEIKSTVTMLNQQLVSIANEKGIKSPAFYYNIEGLEIGQNRYIMNPNEVKFKNLE